MLRLRRRRIQSIFRREDRRQIKEACRKAEERTSGEIKVCLRMRFDRGVRDISTQALRDFEKLGVANTREKTGILILLVWEERKFMILGDSGIHEKLSQAYWDQRARELSQKFREGNFTQALCKAVRDVGERLAEHFPRRPDDTNEMSDDVAVQGDGR